MTSPDFMGRVELTKEGDSAGRDKILTYTLEMISERPILGWGPVEYQYELRRRYSGQITDVPQDPHNLPLNELLKVGILGSVPFFIAIGLSLGAAWSGRRGDLGIIPFALLIATLAGMQFHAFTTSKPMWLVFAVATGAGSAASARSRRQFREHPGPASASYRRHFPS